MSQGQQSPDQEQQKRSLAEWVSFGIASFILAAIAGLVIYEWLVQDNRPPAISVRRAGNTRQVQDQFYIPFAVTNTGGQAADAVQVVAQLRVDGKVEATGEQQISYLSKGETKNGAFIFDRNPNQGKVVLRVTSYQQP
ncbi:TIGR02588 family protein [Gloeocapsopsis crepidinum LEGE 06123]|uniref:TIGR02588 family protein n=1 Tax=Gloeocapsopsis crepidinum LEGE 06123 TaxID=588587 RepID=A0ABR9UYX3_9CHRO|nr:TIGR02588 family protein [Gloeocapsopsis crepidinum]MBE9193516.1 TIGR02588 family protein [Gloeocapsopsis crepidinum LEGE 06123]